MTASEILYERALKHIPWGTQTNAKRPILEYSGTMPYFIERAKGCRFWDVDGDEYIDDDLDRLEIGSPTSCSPATPGTAKRRTAAPSAVTDP